MGYDSSVAQADLDIIVCCGLKSLLDIPQYRINKGLLTALAERWHGDHNPFHLATREMTVTPEDVYYILQIPMVGEIVVCEKVEQGRTDALHRIFRDG